MTVSTLNRSYEKYQGYQGLRYFLIRCVLVITLLRGLDLDRTALYKYSTSFCIFLLF